MTKTDKSGKINRRDFLNGAALSLAGGGSIAPLEAIAQGLLTTP